MNWLFPGFLAGATLIALPVVLHFLRRRQNVIVRFPSLRFLGETALRDTRRHQLRRWLTLLLRCLAIALIAAAFARPFFGDSAARHRQAMVIALDNSMSMQASGRWENYRAWALAQLAELAPGDRAALLAMNPSPAWLVPMTDDLATVRAALQNAQPGFEKTRYDSVLRTAGEILAAQAAGTKTLVWMADEQRSGWLGLDLKQTLPPGVKLRLAETAPAPARQAAIVALQKNLSSAGLTATVRQFQPEMDQRQITVRAGEQVLLQKMILLKAGDNQVELAFAWPTNAAGLRVSLNADNLPADDSAWLVAEKPAATTVLLDSVADADFMAHALSSTEKLGDGALKPGPLPDGVWPADSVVIVRRAEMFRPPRVQRLDHFFDAGGPLWIFADGSPEQAAWLKKHGIQLTPRRAADEPWHLCDWDPEHPALAAFAGQSLLPLLDVEFYKGFDLAGDQLAPLANWPDGKPAFAEWNGGGHRLLLAGFAADRAAMNWPAQPSFVPFVHQAVRWLGSFGAARRDWRVGDVIPLPAEHGQWRTVDALSPQAERAVGGSLRATAPGLYEFSAGDFRKIFAVNIAPEESDLSPWPQPEQLAALESKAAVSARAEASLPLSDTTAENQQRLWWWALAACGAVLLAELALANRTAL